MFVNTRARTLGGSRDIPTQERGQTKLKKLIAMYRKQKQGTCCLCLINQQDISTQVQERDMINAVAIDLCISPSFTPPFAPEWATSEEVLALTQRKQTQQQQEHDKAMTKVSIQFNPSR